MHNVIVFDGPSSSGKTSMSEHIARILGYLFYDAGEGYRGLTAFNLLMNNGELYNETTNFQLLKEFHLESIITEKGRRVFFAGVDVTDELHTQRTSNHVALLSPMISVRNAMREMELRFAEKGNTVFNGRNLGRYIFPPETHPDAILFWSEVHGIIRAQWRHQQYNEKALLENSNPPTFENVWISLRERDKQDRERSLEPVITPRENDGSGYHIIHTANFSPQGAREHALGIIRTELSLRENSERYGERRTA